MKKLMVAVAAVALAIGAQAAATDWSCRITSTGAFRNLDGDLAEGTMYLFASDNGSRKTTMQDLWSTVLSANATKTLAEYAAQYAVLTAADGDLVEFNIGSDGKLSKTSFYSEVDGNNKQSFFAVVDTGDGKYYIDDSYSYGADAISGGAITLALNGAQDETDFGKSATWQGYGWYEAADVPEPTSGLLLLLGVAGLALRRRRA